jgi:hypothetical protein
MAQQADLQQKREMLATIDAEIATRQERFEESIAELRAQREMLRREYTTALRRELDMFEAETRAAPDRTRGNGDEDLRASISPRSRPRSRTRPHPSRLIRSGNWRTLHLQ